MSVFFERLRRLAKAYLWWWILLPLVLILLFFVSIYRSPLYLVSTDHDIAPLSISSQTDREVGGRSEITLLTGTPQQVSFRYTLREGFLNPYTNIRFTPKGDSLFDLSAYDYVHISLRASQGKRVPFYLASDIENYSRPGKDISYQYSLYNLNVSKEETTIDVPFDQLHTPDWWYISNDRTESEFEALDFSRIKYLYFASCINLKRDVQDEISIQELSFHVSLTPFYIGSSIFVLFYYSLFFILLYRKESVVAPINFNYEKVVSRNHQDKEEEIIFQYLDKHYAQQDLSVIDVQNATGIHERKISAIIKKKKDFNFKQFLNDLRISEAKKLLTQTTLPISEIAFQVGYSNASHFNRVFKSLEECSPNDYRKEHS